MSVGSSSIGRLARRFDACRQDGRAALVTFVTAGDPDMATTAKMLAGLPQAGADIIELGMPFSDPMADGPSIQAAGQRALAGGVTLAKTLALVGAFRSGDATTPLVLMGYYNPIYRYGVDGFARDAVAAGADGVILVDLPPEESEEVSAPFAEAGLALIRLATPTTDERRLPRILEGAGGFIYYVSIAGVTGTKSAALDGVADAVAQIREATALPVAVGFGIKTRQDAEAFAAVADGVVVGSAIVDKLNAHGADAALAFVGELASGVRAGRAVVVEA